MVPEQANEAEETAARGLAPGGPATPTGDASERREQYEQLANRGVQRVMMKNAWVVLKFGFRFSADLANFRYVKLNLMIACTIIIYS